MGVQALALGLLLIGFPIAENAADHEYGSIRGYVRDALSGETLPNANEKKSNVATPTWKRRLLLRHTSPSYLPFRLL